MKNESGQIQMGCLGRAFLVILCLGVIGNVIGHKDDSKKVEKQDTIKYTEYIGTMEKSTLFAKDIDSLMEAYDFVQSENNAALAQMTLDQEIFINKEETVVRVKPSPFVDGVSTIVIESGKYQNTVGVAFSSDIKKTK